MYVYYHKEYRLVHCVGTDDDAVVPTMHESVLAAHDTELRYAA